MTTQQAQTLFTPAQEAELQQRIQELTKQLETVREENDRLHRWLRAMKAAMESLLDMNKHFYL